MTRWQKVQVELLRWLLAVTALMACFVAIAAMVLGRPKLMAAAFVAAFLTVKPMVWIVEYELERQT